MNGQQDNFKQYRAEEIIRYLSGKMSREENHAFERTMVDDDMLAESVEGYELMRQSLTDEEILEKAGSISQILIQNEEKKAPVVGLFNFRWVGYAAAAFLVIAAGWWIFSLTQNDQVLPAQTSISPNQDQIVVKADSTPQSSESTNITDIATVEKKVPIIAEQKSTPAKLKQQVPPSNDVAGLTQPSNEIMVEESMASADIRSTPDSIVANGRRNLAASVKIAPSKLLSVMAVDTSEAIPASGWGNYQDYASRQLPKPLENGRGKAILSIEPDGKVSSVQVSGEFNSNQMALAEKVLLNGPRWKSKSGLKAQAILEWQ